MVGGKMLVSGLAKSMSAGTGGLQFGRSRNTVQTTLRTLLWLLLFFVLGIATAALTFLLVGLEVWILAIPVLVIGGLVTLIVPGLITRCLHVVPEFKRVVVLKMGSFDGVKGPGLFWVFPYPPKYQSVTAELDTRVQTRVITAAQTLTKDNVPVGCEAVIFWRVEDPRKAALEVADYSEVVFQAANSALKDTIGTLDLTDLLGERDKVAQQLKHIIDTAASDFGVDVSSVEITDVHVPQDLIQELSVLAQSRRAAQAKIAEAEVEKAVAEKFQEAAAMMGPKAMELYRLNVLERIGREEGSQIVVYGLGQTDSLMEKTMAASAAGSMISAKNKKK